MNEDLDPEVAAAFAGVKAPSAPVSDGLDPEVAAAFRGVGAPQRKARSISRPTTKAPAKPAPKPAAPERELTWRETGAGAIKNLLPSTVGAVKSTADAVLHPVETLKGLGQLGAGVGSRVAGWAGVQQDPAQKAKTEAVVRALEDHYAQTYGSVKGFKKALASDPASILMDASTVLGGAGAALKGTRLGRVASWTSSAIDPVQNALRVATIPAKAAGKIAPAMQAFQTGKSTRSLKLAAQAGATADPRMREAFNLYLKGQGDPADITATAERALSAISKERGQQYIADMAAMKGGALPAIPWSGVERALKDNIAETRFHSGSDSRVVNAEAAKALEEIGEAVDWYRSQPAGSAAHTLEGFDALKRTIGDIRTKYRSDPVAHQKTTAMYNAVLGAIKDVEPGYAAAMEKYGRYSDQLREIGATFSLGKKGKASKESILSKMKRAGHKEFGDDIIAKLAEREPALPYMMAGHELSQWMPGGLRGAIAAAGAYTAHPIAGVVGIASMSPRLNASINQTAGRASKIAKDITRPGITRGAYYASEFPKAGAPLPAVAEAAPQEETGGLTDVDLMKFITGDPEAETVWERMIGQESGGQQFDKSGNTLTSSAGALGIAQVMPATGPEAAQLAGEEWSLERLKNDAEYGLKLGRAYYDAQLARFGDPFLAAAAYNAGPEAVERALRKSEESGQPWLDYLPDETRHYVRAVSRGKFASGGAVDDKVERLVQRLMNLAKHSKKAETKHTESLLGTHDDVVAKALKVAGEAI